nr:Rab family GTPase [Candidatus Sigynarchaeota archaeon]
MVFETPSERVDYKFKLVLTGESGTGKTSLILRFVKDFFKEDLKSTIGTNFMVKTLNLDGKVVQLLIFDIGAQKMFTSMRAKYFQGSNGAISVFDLTSMDSLLAIPEWINSIRDVCGDIPIVIVGNKSDLVDQRAVPLIESQNLASRFTCMYMEASAKSGDHVAELFEKIAKACLENGCG